MEWTSPDDKIFKKILLPGQWGTKPYEASSVKINLTDCNEDLKAPNGKLIVIGDSDGELGRMLDLCITTMHPKEKSLFTITINLEQISVTIELIELNFNGFNFEWTAKKKYDMALMHKEKGADWFRKNNEVEAAYRFSKALKIISSIPMDVEEPPSVIDDIELSNITALKEKLFNNLSSCYFRKKYYDLVVPLCNKVLITDSNNVKALYKLGVAYEADKNYEKAHEMLGKALELEPQNKACADHMANVRVHLKQANYRVNEMMKKMIVGSISK